MGDGWETARNPTRPPVLEADSKGILQVMLLVMLISKIEVQVLKMNRMIIDQQATITDSNDKAD